MRAVGEQPRQATRPFLSLRQVFAGQVLVALRPIAQAQARASSARNRSSVAAMRRFSAAVRSPFDAVPGGQVQQVARILLAQVDVLARSQRTSPDSGSSRPGPGHATASFLPVPLRPLKVQQFRRADLKAEVAKARGRRARN